MTDQPNGEVATILLVEDSPQGLLALETVLAPLGQRLVPARSGEEALRLLLEEEFAVVLMDVKLPGIDGYETASLMRGAQRTRMVPIIFLTGVHREPAEVLRGYNKGAVDYLLKPFDPEILRSKVSVFVELHLMRERVRALTRSEALHVIAEADRARLLEKEQERRLLQAVVKQMPAGVMVVQAPGGEVLLSNDRFAEIVGRIDDLEHAPLNVDGSPCTELPIARTLRTGETIEGETIIYPRARGSVRLSLSAAPVYDDADRVIAVVGTAFDVSERHAAEQERERLIAALEKSNAELEQFAYVASHDLKTPLRGIASISSWIEQDLGEGVSDEIRKHMELLRKRVYRMEALINGILEFARAGRIRGDDEEIALSAFFREVVDLLSPDARVQIEISEDLPTVRSPRIPFQQVLLNLIGNAIKHAHRADPLVRIHAQVAAANLHLTIADNGPGIAQQFHERIWGMFQTLEPRDKADNTGIGLAVVRKIVESRGGKTWVESEVGSGATFHILWPVALVR